MPLHAQTPPDQTPAYMTIDLGPVSSTATLNSFGKGVVLNASGQVAAPFAPFPYPPGSDKAYVWHQGALSNLEPGSFSPNSGPIFFYVNGFNDSGQVVARDVEFGGSTSVVLQDGAVTPLGSFGVSYMGYGNTTVNAINRPGQAVGTSTVYDAHGMGHGLAPFLWDKGTLTNLGTFGVDPSGQVSGEAIAINDLGQVACVTERYTAAHADLGPASFVWQNGVPTDLGSLGTGTSGVGSTTVKAMNNLGQAVGTSDVYDAKHAAKGSAAFLWRNGLLTSLGTLGTNSGGRGKSVALAINDQGQTVGWSYLYDAHHTFQGQVGCLWQNGSIVKMGVPSPPPGSGQEYSTAVGLNNRGQVVGVYTAYSDAGAVIGVHPYVWQNGQLTDLFPFLPSGVYTPFLCVTGINDQGEITLTVPLSQNPTLQANAFLLRPRGLSGWAATGVSAGTDGTRLLWNNVNGSALVWNAPPNAPVQYGNPFTLPPGEGTQAIATDAQGASRLLLAGADGHARVWTVKPDGTIEKSRAYGPVPGGAVHSLTVDTTGHTRLLWTTTDGRAFVWTLRADGTATHSPAYGPAPHQHVKTFAVAPDGTLRLLWQHVSGSASVWTIHGTRVTKSPVLGPEDGWTAQGFGVGRDGVTRLLWTHWDGRMRVDTLTAGGAVTRGTEYGPFAGYTARSISAGGNDVAQVLWTNADGQMTYWSFGPQGVSFSPIYGPY